MKHQYNCKCQRCSMGEIEYKKWELEQMKIYNFIVHMVIDDCDCPLHANFHTHGLLEKFNHLDIQICFPLDQQIVMGIIHDCVKQIKKGIKLEPGKKYPDIVHKYDVEFIYAKENGRTVVRLLVCDKDGGYSGPFAEQFKMTGLIAD